MTMWDKTTRRVTVAAVFGWGFLVGLAVARHFGRRLFDPLTVSTMIGMVASLSILAGLGIILHGHVYQLGYVAGRTDAADCPDDADVVQFRPTHSDTGTGTNG